MLDHVVERAAARVAGRAEERAHVRLVDDGLVRIAGDARHVVVLPREVVGADLAPARAGGVLQDLVVRVVVRDGLALGGAELAILVLVAQQVGLAVAVDVLVDTQLLVQADQLVEPGDHRPEVAVLLHQVNGPVGRDVVLPHVAHLRAQSGIGLADAVEDLLAGQRLALVVPQHQRRPLGVRMSVHLEASPVRLRVRAVLVDQLDLFAVLHQVVADGAFAGLESFAGLGGLQLVSQPLDAAELEEIRLERAVLRLQRNGAVRRDVVLPRDAHLLGDLGRSVPDQLFQPGLVQRLAVGSRQLQRGRVRAGRRLVAELAPLLAGVLRVPGTTAAPAPSRHRSRHARRRAAGPPGSGCRGP